MPSWNEVLNKIAQNPLDSVRREYLKKLSEKTGRNVNAYYSGWLQKGSYRDTIISDGDKNGFMATIHKLDRKKGLDLLLHTPGGDLTATESIVDYLHKMFGNNIRAIIPQISMSAGTMIAFMDKFYFMQLAIEQAKLSAQEDEIPIGAVIEYNGEVFATGRNRRIQKNSAIAHAEIEAIENATKKLKDWRLENMTLYVTVEPCIMCAGAIIHSRIKRVVYGCSEPKMGAVQTLAQIFDLKKLHHRPEYVKGVMEEECKELLSKFFNKLRTGYNP